MGILSILATDPTPSATFSDFSNLMSTFLQTFSISNIVATLSSILGASVGFVFLWWGVRKLFSAITKATMRGKVKL